MKRNIISIALCVAMLFQFTVFSVNADSQLTDASYTINYETGSTSISFEGALPGTRATLVVLNPGKTLDDALSDGAIQYQREVVADDKGGVNHSFVLNVPRIPENKEYYPVYVKMPGREAENIISMCYAGKNDMIDAIDSLKGSIDDVKALLTDGEMALAMGLSTFEPYSKLDLDLLAARLAGRFSAFESSGESFDAVSAYLKEFCVLELYNQNMPSEVYSEEGTYLWEDVLGFDAFDKEKGSCFNECYSTLLTAEGKAQIRTSLFGKNISTPEELMKEFALNTVLIGLRTPKATGYGHVEKLLSAKNREIIGLTLSRELTGDVEVQLAAYGGSFADLLSLKNYIESLFTSVDNSGTGSVNSSSSGNKGGSVGSGSFSVGTGYVPPTTAPAETVVFADVAEDNWAFKAIVYLKAKGAVNGVEGNLFLPEGQVTREQFVKMLFAVLDITPSEEISTEFTDVDASAWYAPYICAAVERGIVKGISDTEFGVGMNATRQDICTMLYRALDIEAAKYKDFTDMSDVADYAYDAVGILSANGIVTGYPDGSFRPRSLCTRAEAASLIYNSAMLTEVK